MFMLSKVLIRMVILRLLCVTPTLEQIYCATILNQLIVKQIINIIKFKRARRDLNPRLLDS